MQVGTARLAHAARVSDVKVLYHMRTLSIQDGDKDVYPVAPLASGMRIGRGPPRARCLSYRKHSSNRSGLIDREGATMRSLPRLAVSRSHLVRLAFRAIVVTWLSTPIGLGNPRCASVPLSLPRRRVSTSDWLASMDRGCSSSCTASTPTDAGPFRTIHSITLVQDLAACAASRGTRELV